jgi:hypothetical protein
MGATVPVGIGVEGGCAGAGVDVGALTCTATTSDRASTFPSASSASRKMIVCPTVCAIHCDENVGAPAVTRRDACSTPFTLTLTATTPSPLYSPRMSSVSPTGATAPLAGATNRTLGAAGVA